MKNNIKATLIFCFACLCILLGANISLASISSLPWSTTFNCAEWDQAKNGYNSVGCDGITQTVGDWYADGHGEQITSAANNSGGEGGRGQRHWFGDSGNGTATAPGSGGLLLELPSPTNFYIRFYFRFQSGLPINALEYWKVFYLYDASMANSLYMDTESDGKSISLYDRSARHTGSYSFDDAYGGNIANGSWHAAEFHFDLKNGIFEYWFYPNGQDTPTAKYTASVNYPMSSIKYIKFPENHKAPEGTLPGGDMYVDFDDIAIRTTGRIGPLGAGSGGGSGTDTTTISPVQNLKVVPTSTPDPGGSGNATSLLQESFENTNLASNGWYDNTNLVFSTAEHATGSTRSLAFTYNQGATTPTSGGAIRHKITPTDQLYVSYYVKYSTNWTGSNQTYQPHEFYVLTNKDTDYSGLSSTYLTTYIEQNEGIPLVSMQDSKNIDESRINVDLTNTTEARAVAGCNGSSDSYGVGSCYAVGSVHQNIKEFRANAIYFKDTTGQYYKSDWHKVAVFLKLNSIANGKGVADGVIRYWLDGQELISHSNVFFRTAENADMKFAYFIIGPFIGDGSPVTQTFWIDNLALYNGMP